MKNYLFICLSLGLLISGGCRSGSEVFIHIAEQSDDCIGVYGTAKISEEQFNRVYEDVKEVMDQMHTGIRQGLLNSGVVMMVVTNEAELEGNIDFFEEDAPFADYLNK